ncbi:hypothetical protein LCE31_12760, partial [Streptomyces sp. 8L]|nr:hypothetical protein [Streptomyces sp. 8L]
PAPSPSPHPHVAATVPARAAATPEQRLGALLLRMVREQDDRIPPERRVPRTLAEMTDRQQAAEVTR